jgi:hypothetical protein
VLAILTEQNGPDEEKVVDARAAKSDLVKTEPGRSFRRFSHPARLLLYWDSDGDTTTRSDHRLGGAGEKVDGGGRFAGSGGKTSTESIPRGRYQQPHEGKGARSDYEDSSI